MIPPAVNVLVYAHRPDVQNHIAHRTWLEDLLAGDRAYGMSDFVLSGFLRIVTHRRIFLDQSPIEKALAFAEEVRTPPQCVPVRPGPRHWDIFRRLCLECRAKGNLVPDAFLAALAIEQGCEWITTDRDYARFTGLKWRHGAPLTRLAAVQALPSCSRPVRGSPAREGRMPEPRAPRRRSPALFQAAEKGLDFDVIA